MTNDSNHITTTTDTPKPRKWRKRLLWFALFLFLLLIIGYWALQQPSTRNWVKDKALEYGNTTIKGDVQIEDVEIDLPNVNFNHALVTTPDGDTTIYAKRIELNIISTLRSLFGGSAHFDRIGIEDALVKFHRAEGGHQTSIDTVFQGVDYFWDPNYYGPQDPKKPIDLQAKVVYLTNVRVVGEDLGYGNSQDIFIPSGQFELKSMDVPNNVLTIDNAIFNEPTIKLRAWDGVEPVFAPRDPLVDTFPIRPKVMVVAHHAQIVNAYLDNVNTRPAPRTFEPEEINWNDMRLRKVNVTLDSFNVREQDYYGDVSKASFVHEDGFAVLDMEGDEMFLTTKGLQAKNLKLITPESNLKMDYLNFKYNEYNDYLYFENRVYVDGSFDNTRMTSNDLRKLKGLFSTNPFFIQNKDTDFYLDGQLYGKINALKAKDISVKVGDDMELRGSFSSRNLAVKNEEFLDLDLDTLLSTVRTLQRIIPGLDLPPQFNKLGRVAYNGQFIGFFNDFVTDGSMITDLGNVNLNMKFNGIEGRQQSQYSGDLAINNFDLRTWTGSDDFNRAQFSAKIEKGRGLTLESVNTDLSGNVEFLEFKGYTYRDVNINGFMAKSLFDGELAISDPNADFIFDGTIDFQDSIPQFDFIADIKALDLEKLNLSKEALSVNGLLDVDLLGIDLAKITGSASVSDLTLKGIADQPITIDSVYLTSKNMSNGDQYFSLSSEEIDADFVGQFDLGKLSQSVKTHLKKNHPSFTKGIVIKNPDSLNVSQSFRYSILLKDLERIGETFFPNVPPIKNATVEGYFDNVNDSLIMNFRNPAFEVGNARFDNFSIQVKSSRDDGFVNMFFDSLAINNQNRLSALTLNGAVLLDTLQFELNTIEDDEFNVNFEIAKINDAFNLKLLPKDLKIFGSEWIVNENNEIIFNNDKLNVRDLRLSNEDTRARIYQSSATGMEMVLSGFNASIVNDLWNEPKLDFEGDYDLLFGLRDIFTGDGLYGTVFMDTLSINEDDWGSVDLEFSSNNLKSPFDFDFRMQRDERYIDAAGIFFPKNVSTKTYQGKPTEYFDFDLDMENVPLQTVEYFIPHIFSESKGGLDFYANLSGIPTNVGMRGDAVIKDGSMKVNYLNTTYAFDRLDIDILPEYFDFSDNKILDELGNEARITGGIGHKIFKDFRYDFGLSANELLAFNTQKGDNDIYYGRGIGSVNGSLRGPFPRPEMVVNATSLEGTTVYVPLEDSGEVGDLDFITFTSDQDSTSVEDEANYLRDVRGMNIDINLTLTEDAKTFLIFDERSGDVIQSVGNAGLNFNITRTGEFSMNGEYIITEGEYLFTLLNIINKPFTVARGGVIRWTGDPYGADLWATSIADRGKAID